MTVGDTNHGHFPPQVLREYALLADGERGAVLGPRGDIVWMCAPRWDSDAVFTALLGGAGGYAVTPAGRYVWGGYYEEGTLIWRSRWVTDTGIVECREALAFPGDPATRCCSAGSTPSTRHVGRRVLEPRAGYDHQELTDLHRSTACGPAAPAPCTCAGAAPATPDPARQRRAAHRRAPDAGQHHDLVLEISDHALPEHPVDPDAAWRATETAWQAAVPALEHLLDPRDTRRSYAVLRGLTAAGGGMVAAATTSLPERAEAGRNYDYRYVWIRDQCYAGQAVAAAGPHPLLDDAVRFVTDRLLEHGDRLAPAYTTTGGPVPDQRHLDLPGYPGGDDIIGNWVNQQFQLDAFGEALLLFAAAARHDRLDTDHWQAAEAAAARSPAAGPNPTPASGRSTTGPGPTAG